MVKVGTKSKMVGDPRFERIYFVNAVISLSRFCSGEIRLVGPGQAGASCAYLQGAFCKTQFTGSGVFQIPDSEL